MPHSIGAVLVFSRYFFFIIFLCDDVFSLVRCAFIPLSHSLTRDVSTLSFMAGKCGTIFLAKVVCLALIGLCDLTVW